jgi:hypothetical protein
VPVLPLPTILFGLIAVSAAAGIFGSFLRLERHGRRLDVIVILVLVLVADATLYPDTEATRSVGIFHPYIAGQNFRLSQLLIGMALAARMLTSGLPRRLSGAEALWLAFFVWYATACVAGVLHGNNPQLVIARGMFILEAGGMLALTAGVPARDLVGDKGIPRLTRWCGLLAAVLVVTSGLGVRVTTSWPGLPLASTGGVGPNLATIFVSLGALGLAAELGRERRRVAVLLGGTAMLLAHLMSSQRAARLGLGVLLVSFLVVLLIPRGRPRPFARHDAAALGAGLLLVVSIPLLAWSVTERSGGSPLDAFPVLDRTVQALDTGYRQGSVQSRYNEWDEAMPLIKQHLVLGNGVGTTFDHHDVGKNLVITYDLTNNLVLDLLLRVGVVGLVAFLAAWVATSRVALLVWRRCPDGVALLAVAAGCGLAGLVAKAMVESVINEYRMTVLIGLLAGVVFSCGRDLPTETGSQRLPPGAGAEETKPEASAPR